MTRNDLAVLIKNRDYAKIIEWADKTGIEQMQDVDFLLFAAEAYENAGFVKKGIKAYWRALEEYEEENAAAPLLNLYKWIDDYEALEELADYLEEQGFCDDVMLLARFEALRAKDAELDEQIEALKEYLDEYYNDELYHILLMELYLEIEDDTSLKRFLNKFYRIFTNSNYQDDYVKPLEQALEKEQFGKMKNSICELIYKKIECEDSVPRSETRNADTVSISTTEIEKTSTAKPNLPQKKVRAKTVSLYNLIHGELFQNMVKKDKIKNEEPPTMEERFQRIVGMKNVRDKVGNVYRALKMQNEKKDETAYNANMLPYTNFIITGRRGSGKTLLAETIAEILVDFGIRGEEEAVSIEAKDFCESYDNLEKDATNLKDRTLIIENIERAMDVQGHFDEFAWKLRQYMKAHQDDMSIILTGTKDVAMNLLSEEKDIGEMIYPMNDTYDILEYSTDELMEIMDFEAADLGWQLTKAAKESVRKQLDKEKKMTTFACGKSIQEKLASAQIKAANRFDQLENVEEVDMVFLEEEDFARDGLGASVPELLEKLDKMVGLAAVKEKVNNLVTKIIVDQEAEKLGVEKRKSAEPLHMIFKGAPGTGKTTVARIIGEIYMALGVLPGNKQGFWECTAKDLISQHVGETAIKTQKMIDNAMGGVLFVDEAYSLTQNQFGAESITTFLTALENSRDSIMVIFAGYEEDMDKFLDLNGGLRSRIRTQILFEDYTPDEMFTIFMDIASENGRFLAPDTKDSLKELIKQASMGLDFGNARGVRNLFDEVDNAVKDRIYQMYDTGIRPTSNDYILFKKEDFESVLESYKAGSQPLEELLEDLNSMEGMESLKEVVNRTVNAVKAYKKKKENEINARLEIGSMHMIFTGAPGTGKTTMARKIGAIYKALGILPRGNELNECDGKDLIGQFQGQTAPIVAEKIKHSMGGILFVDEAYQLSRSTSSGSYGQEACDAFIKELEDKRDKFMLILAGYTKEMNEFLDTNPGFRSRIPNIIHFDDYSVDQMVSIFKKMVAEKGYTIEEGTDQTIKNILAEKSTEQDFGNARGVRNVLQIVIENLDSRIANDDVPMEEYKIIKKEDIQKVIENGKSTKEEKDIDAILEELDSMIGLASVKAAVHKIVSRAQYYEYMRKQGIDNLRGFGSLHMLFKGNAGTGKTTVARMIGQIYKQLGVLRRGHLVECSRGDLVAGFIGQTASKTQAVINSAMGGILFVDEAYTLSGKGENDFGKEALETIMKAMEDKRSDLMVIFAGYSKEIDELIVTNQGLESRFSKQNEIIFEDYTLDELLQIFLFQTKGMGIHVEDSLYSVIKETIEKAKVEAQSFGNARGVRNLVESIDGNRQQRIQQLVASGVRPDAQTVMSLTEEDFSDILGEI